MSADVAARLEAVAARLEAVAAKLGKKGGSSSGDADEIPMEVTEWDEIMADLGAKFVGTAKELGIAEVVSTFNDLTAFCRNYMIAAAQCSKPSDAELKSFLAPLQAAIGVTKDVIRDDFFDFRKGWSEAAEAFQWVLTPGPHSYIGGIKDSSQFYLNKILVAAKRLKDEDQVARYKNFNKYLLQLFAKMVEFTKENYKTGVTWTGSKPITEFSGAAAPAAAAPEAKAEPEAKAAPAKPAASSSSSSAPGGLGSVFAELNAKREAGSVTAGFKKVTASMKTKNMKDKPVLVAKPKKKPTVFKRKAEAKKRPPKKALARGKWIIEYFENGDESVDDATLKQTVYIYKCRNQVIRVPNKVKTVIVDNCNRVTVVVGDIVSMVECVNSSGTKVFVDGVVPSIAVDGCKGFHATLTEKAVGAPPVVIAASSSEMNVLIPNGEEDPIEVALSEQFEHRVDVSAFTVACTPVEHG